MTTEALLLALALSRTLSRPKSCDNVVVLADQLGRLRGMLRDIGMPDNVLIEVGMRRLKVAEVIAGAYGDEEWVLHDLWQCALDHVWALPWYRPDRSSAAQEAANAARRLISIGSKHAKFYRACSLHYDAISGCSNIRAYDNLKQAVNLFRDTVSSTSPYDHVEEMMRAMRSLSESKHYNDQDMKATYDQISEHDSNPTLTLLWAEMCANIYPQRLGDDSLERTLRLKTHMIKVLGTYQHARTRIRRLLARVLASRGRCLVKMDRRSDAITDFEEAIYVQARLVKFGREDDIEGLSHFVWDCVYNHVRLKRWDDAVDSVKRSLEIVQSHSRARSHIISGGLYAFYFFLDDSRDLSALPAAHTLVDILRPFRGSNHSEDVLDALIDVLVTVSGVHREIGDFQAALDTSRDALAVARERRSRYSNIYSLFRALGCHANALVDADAYDDAIVLFQEAISISKSFDRDDAHRSLGMFGVVHAHVSGDDSCVDDVISASDTFPTSCSRPYWLSTPRFYDNSYNRRAWLLLIRSVIECTTTPPKALTSARESFKLMWQYYEKLRADMDPDYKMSVLGHQYILLTLLGEREQGQSVLNESITLFRMVLDDDPRMARLPLLIFLEVLLVLLRPLPLPFETSTLQKWKSVYQGSTGFFDDFVVLLQSLPHYIHGRS